MKTIFQNKECIILYDDHSFHPEASDTSRVVRWLGFDTLIHAQEVWIYRPATKKFHAYKNKGMINEAIHRIFDFGIKLIPCPSSSPTALRFATPKDQFYFELKF